MDNENIKNENKESRFKRFLPIILVIVIAVGLIGGGTLAYTTREARAENEITAGDIDVELFNMLDADTAMPEEGIYGVLANISYPNIVYAYNNCDYPEYIRMRVSKEVTDKEGNTLDSSKFVPNINTKDWTYSEKDGYYYYNHILEPHKNSAPLYESIYFDKTVNNRYKTATLDMHIVVEAVQSDNNGESVFEAEGWEVKAVS